MRVVRVDSDGFEIPDQGPLEPFLEPELQPDPSGDPEPDFPLVLVSWHDAWFDFDQQDPEDCRPDYVVRTVGFLVSDGPRFVSVAQEVLPEGDGFRAVTHIPRSIIESLSYLDEAPSEERDEG